jgi:endonuclease III
MNLKEHSQIILKALKAHYPGADCQLVFKNPLQLLVSTILSAQCTDKRVNLVTVKLFKKYKSVQDFSRANLAELENIIRSVGLYHNKALNIIKCCTLISKELQGKVPKTMQELTRLNGIGRKTANVILGNAFGIQEGIAVDTHVIRLSKRLALTKHSEPVKIEKELMKIIPKKEWTMFTHYIIAHGRAICKAPTPLCKKCFLADLCPKKEL